MIKNASLSLFQTLFSIFVLFFSYRFIVEQLGIKQLGLWALFTSIVSLARIAELGLAGSVVKFVASALANDDIEKARAIIQTVTLSVAILVSLLSVTAYFPALYLVLHILGNESTTNTPHILALAFVATWLTSMAGVNKASLDGCQRYDLSTIAVIISTLVFITGIIILVPRYELYGLAYAYILQGASLILVTRLLLMRAINNLPLLPFQFSLTTFKEIRSYGLKFQLISIFTLLGDPLTKALLGRFGNIGMIGCYELANKFITQMRSLLVAMNQVLVPKISESKAKGILDISQIYKKNYQLISFTSVYFYTALVCIVPIIEILWLKEKAPLFELFSIISVCAYFTNTLCIPSYMINTGTGELRSNVLSHIFMGLVNLFLGLAFGIYFGGIGVVISSAIALMAGSLPIIYSFHKRNNIQFSILAPKPHILGLIIGLVGVVISWRLHYHPLITKMTFHFSDIVGRDIVFSGDILTFSFTFLIIFIFIIIPMWKNPTRKIITDLIHDVVKSRNAHIQ